MSISRVPLKKHNIYIGYTTIKLFHPFTDHLSENNIIKQYLIIKHNNSTKQFIFSEVKKILTDNIIIIYENNNKSERQYALKMKRQT